MQYHDDETTDGPLPFHTPREVLDAFRKWMNLKNHPGNVFSINPCTSHLLFYLFGHIKLKTFFLLYGSSGLVVMEGDSSSEGCGFKFQHHILGGHFFTFICCKNCNVCLKRQNILERSWDGQFTKKTFFLNWAKSRPLFRLFPSFPHDTIIN